MMASRNLTVGADRFLALEWANHAYELFESSEAQVTTRKVLREYLETQMVGQESIRKTANQLNRLWLDSGDPYISLRNMTRSLSHPINASQVVVLHLGMAINVFPIYRETARVIGTLERITDQISIKSITSRVIEKFPTTSSIPRTVSRVLQTLTDWRFIEVAEGNVTIRELPIQNPKLVNWYIFALLKATQQHEITLSDLEICPLKLGINFAHPRRAITVSEEMTFLHVTSKE